MKWLLRWSKERLLPLQAVGLRAPQTIIRRPLPSPDRHNKSAHAVCSCGHSLGNTPGQLSIIESFPSSRFQLSHSLACVVDNVFIIFSHRSPRMFRFFHFSKQLFTFSFSVLPWWSNHFLVENMHLVIDQRPACPNLTPPWTLTSEMVPLGRNPWR